jgi:hypothetical protein
MVLTKNGICYDLKNSPYFCFVGFYKFFFSSPAHLNRFKVGLETNRDWLNDSMTRRFKFEMQMDLLADFSLYRKIETRGFLIINESTGVAYECPESIEFRGMTIN